MAFFGSDCSGSTFKGYIELSNARILNIVISFLTFQVIVATIKKKEYNFLDQRKMDFDHDYEEFCKQTHDLHVGCIIKFLLTAVCLFFPFCVIITYSAGRDIYYTSQRRPVATSACVLWFQINNWRLFFTDARVINIALDNDLQSSACLPS